MCEWIIFAKDQWMEELAPEVIAIRIATDPKFEAKYNARYKKGDYIECRDNGYWSGVNGKGFDVKSFELVCEPTMSLEDGQEYCRSHDQIENEGEENEERITLKRRKYNIDRSSITFESALTPSGRKQAILDRKNFEDITLNKEVNKTLTVQKVFEAEQLIINKRINIDGRSS